MNMIVAFCKNRGMGFQNKLPWHIPNELKYFKRKTSRGDNNVVIMGKNTWESLPKKPLKNRKNIILSQSLNNNHLIKYENTIALSNFEELNKNIDNLIDDHKIWIIGGKSIYDYYIKDPKLDKIYVTHIHKTFSYDVKFPDIPEYFTLYKNTNLIYENDIIYNYSIYKNSLR